MLVPTTGWKLTNHHKTCLSVQCDISCNCCSSVPIGYNISVLNDSRCIVSFLCGSGFGMLLLGKAQKKHSRDLPPTFRLGRMQLQFSSIVIPMNISIHNICTLC